MCACILGETASKILNRPDFESHDYTYFMENSKINENRKHTHTNEKKNAEVKGKTTEYIEIEKKRVMRKVENKNQPKSTLTPIKL